jgi:molybdenum cofactor biosynthesis protein A
MKTLQSYGRDLIEPIQKRIVNTLFDNHGRPLNYLRLAVTDRCNLRCFYCMPEEGVTYLPKKELLTFEEIIRIVTLMASMGISKIRLTGGEPFLRNDLMSLIRRIIDIPGIREWHITTNGILTSRHIPDLKALGVGSVNLSLDTLDEVRFRAITRRDEFRACLETLDQLLHHDIPVKINAVVMEGKNIEDIIPIAQMTKNKNVSVRFIEEMPFNGSDQIHPTWSHRKIVDHLRSQFPGMSKLADPESSTSSNYRIPGHLGTIGVIAAFSRTFCGTCNRVRLTAQGMLKTCLYDDGVLDIKKLMRSGMPDEDLRVILLAAFQSRPADGFAAEENRKNKIPIHESMSAIGG